MSRHALRPSFRTLTLTLALTGAAFVAPGCGSDGPTRPTVSRDAVLQAPEAHVPDGVSEIRSELAGQRASTLEQMDVRSGNTVSPDGAPSGGHWYGPIFDVLEFGASFGHLFW